MNCKNCDKVVTEAFCPYCGQRTSVDKINVPNFLREVSGSVFQINRGLLFTIRELFIRPGQTIRNYLSGKRKPYFKPIAYAFTLSTIYFLISGMLGSNTFVSDFAMGWANGVSGNEVDQRQLAILNWFGRNYGYTILLLLPIFSLGSFIAFRKFRLNYLEHVALNAYITGHQAIFYAVFAVFLGIFDNHATLEIGSLVVSIGYGTLVHWRLYTSATRIGIILRTIATYSLYLVFSSVFMGIVLALTGLK